MLEEADLDDWRVSGEPFGSDHRQIHFALKHVVKVK